jgi:hypothetical protein
MFFSITPPASAMSAFHGAVENFQGDLDAKGIAKNCRRRILGA